MIRVDKLIKELQKFPQEALAYAYEGEMTGIVIVDNKDNHLGQIFAREGNDEE